MPASLPPRRHASSDGMAALDAHLPPTAFPPSATATAAESESAPTPSCREGRFVLPGKPCNALCNPGYAPTLVARENDQGDFL